MGFYKSNVFSYLGICETLPIRIRSFNGIQICLFGIILLYFISKGYANKFLVFYGTTISMFMLTLNFRHQVLGIIVYMYIFSNEQVITFLYKVSNNLDIPKIIIIFLTISSLFIGISTFMVAKGQVCTTVRYAYDCIDLLDIPKDSHIFNTMNVGPYLEYKGYTDIYIDTRPELYTKEVCGTDYMGTYLKLVTGMDMDTPAYHSLKEIRTIYEEYDYIMILKTDYLYIDLIENPNYRIIASKDNFVVYKRQ